jgi:hypothetical protein
MSDIYCGVGKVPKGKSLGSMAECAEKSQIRYYGLKKIDPRIIEAVKNKKAKPVTRDKLLVKHTELHCKQKKMAGLIEKEKDKTKKAKIEKDLKKTTLQLKDVVKNLKLIDARKNKAKKK